MNTHVNTHNQTNNNVRNQSSSGVRGQIALTRHDFKLLVEMLKCMKETEVNFYGFAYRCNIKDVVLAKRLWRKLRRKIAKNAGMPAGSLKAVPVRSTPAVRAETEFKRASGHITAAARESLDSDNVDGARDVVAPISVQTDDMPLIEL